MRLVAYLSTVKLPCTMEIVHYVFDSVNTFFNIFRPVLFSCELRKGVDSPRAFLYNLSEGRTLFDRVYACDPVRRFPWHRERTSTRF